MKVALISPYAWDYPGGVNEHIRNLYLRLKERGHEVKVLAPQDSPGDPLDFNPGDFIPLGGSLPVRFNRSTAHICFSPGASSRVKKILHNENFDILHLHEPLIPSVSLLALQASTIPAVATFHAYREKGSVAYALAGPLLRRWWKLIQARVAVSEAARTFVSRYFPGEYHIIPNGYDNRLFTPASTPPWKDESQPFLLFVGREDPRKGLSVLLKAFNMISQERPEMILHIVGIDDFSSRLRKKISQAAEKRIRVNGRLSGEDLADMYRRAWVVVAPSLGGESFGIILAEAMACGAPVVASDIPGYRGVLGKCGKLVTPGNHQELASAIMGLIGDTPMLDEMRRKGLERAGEFSWDRVAERVESLYHRVLCEKGRKDG